MSKIITVSGDTFRQFIFGVEGNENREEFDKYNNIGFRWRGTANRQASESYFRSQNPYARPVAFTIPSGFYSDLFYQQMTRNSRYYTDEDWEEYISPPTYIISSYLSVGGTYNHYKASLEIKNLIQK